MTPFSQTILLLYRLHLSFVIFLYVRKIKELGQQNTVYGCYGDLLWIETLTIASYIFHLISVLLDCNDF